MADREQVERLLHAGETVEEAVEWDGASVVVTSHRVLAFTPEMEGANFESVDRPNVEGVTAGARSSADLLERGVRYGLIGAVLLVAGFVVDFGGLVGGVSFDAGPTGQLGLGGVLGLVQGLLDLIAQLDRLLRLFGALALFLAAVFVGVYWYTRTPTLTIRVAGGDDVDVPRPDEATERRLADLLGRTERGLAERVGIA